MGTDQRRFEEILAQPNESLKNQKALARGGDGRLAGDWSIQVTRLDNGFFEFLASKFFFIRAKAAKKTS